MTIRSGKLDSLQAGRGIAALMVVLHHANQAADHFLRGEGRYDILNYGYLGVDFFFVLSGFIIYHTTSHQSGRGRTFNTFLALRMARVFAPYLPLGIAFGVLYTFPAVVSEANREWSWVPTLSLIPWGLPPALSVAWTLQNELVFYLIFGLLFFSGLLRLGLTLWLVAILGFALLANPAPPEPFATALTLINIEFIFGLLAALALVRNIEKRLWLALLGAGAAAAVWIALGASRELSVFVGAAIAILIPSLARAEMNGGFSTPSTLVLLGDASYSIYLIHPLAIAVSARLLRSWMPISLEFGLVVMVLASVGAGLVYHLLFERHAIRALRNWVLVCGTSERAIAARAAQ